MKEYFKNRLRRIVSALPLYRGIKNELEFRRWKNDKNSTEAVPHRVKQQVIASYQQQYGCKVLVETGTYLGDMIAAQQSRFEYLYSIELSPELHRKAQRRFRRNSQVCIVQGDSAKVLPGLLQEISSPALFWLDGHYSAGITAKGATECPVFDELTAIFGCGMRHPVILIDDARCYTGAGDYPSLESLQQFIDSHPGGYTMKVEDDVIRLT